MDNKIEQPQMEWNLGTTIMAIWLAVFLISKFFDVTEIFYAYGSNNIGIEYYRYFTAPFLNVSMGYILINSLLAFSISKFLGHHVKSVRVFFLVLITSALSFYLFSLIFPNSYSSGGSPLSYSLLGFIIASQLLNVFPEKLTLRSSTSILFMIEFFITNIFLFKDSSIIVIIHSFALFISLVISSILLYIKPNFFIKYKQ